MIKINKPLGVIYLIALIPVFLVMVLDYTFSTKEKKIEKKKRVIELLERIKKEL